MSLLYSPAATATVAANTNSVAIAGMDLATVLPGMVINLGARDRVAGDGYIIATVVPTGSSGGTLTTVGAIPTAFTSAGFVIDTRDFNGTAPNYLIASYTQVLNALLRLTSPLTTLFTGSRQVALDKDNAPAVSRLLYAIAGRLWGAVEQRTVTYTPTGGAQVTTETLSLRAYPDGTTPVDTLMIDLATGGADLRKASASMASAATTDLGSAPTGKIALTGSATVVSFGVGRHLERLVHVVDGGATLTHNATSLVLPGGANIVTAAGDTFHATSDGSGNWRVRHYQRATGRPLVNPAPGDMGLGTGSSPAFAGLSISGAATVNTLNANVYQLGGGDLVRNIGSNYMAFYAGSLQFITLTTTDADKTTYFSNDRAVFRSRDNATTMLTVGATGLIAPGSASFGGAIVAGGPIAANQTARGALDYLQANRATRLLTYSHDATAAGFEIWTAGSASAPTRALTLSSGGNLAVTGTVGATGYQIGGDTILGSIGSGAYRGFMVGGIQLMIAGDSTDPTTYYGNTAHLFRSRNLTTTFATISAAGIVSTGPVRPGSYTVATLPAGTAGAVVYASNACKVGEAAGSGTGVISYYSNGNWRRLSDDSVTAA